MGRKAYPSRFLVKDGAKRSCYSVDKIDGSRPPNTIQCLHANGRRLMLRETISGLSEKLDPAQFVRIHRSSIVNLEPDQRNLSRRAR